MLRRVAVRLGERLIWLSMRKCSALMFNIIVRGAYRILEGRYGPDEVIGIMREVGRKAGYHLAYDMACRWGQVLLARRVEEFADEIRAGHYIYLGTEAEVEVEKGEGEVVVRVRDPRCIVCEGVKADFNYCEMIASGHEGAHTVVAELMGIPVRVEARETRCRARGDPYCEFEIKYVRLE